jgi:DNA-binding NarL/FixJ family response regulator
VRDAKELQPDLIFLDIGLPMLDGIEAARQIRTHCPHSKIMFVTQESAAQFVQEAFRIGAMAYVTKIRARKELLAAVDLVLDGRQFVSAGLQSEASVVNSA